MEAPASGLPSSSTTRPRTVAGHATRGTSGAVGAGATGGGGTSPGGRLALGGISIGGMTTGIAGGTAAGAGVSPGGTVSATGFVWLGGIAVVSTVGAIALFFAGLRRVGPSAASILSTVEPVVTVALAYAVFGESLGLAQLAGGALVLAAVVAVNAPARRPVAARA